METTNQDGTPHTFTVQGLLLRGGKLVGVATGALEDLAPDETRTVILTAPEALPERDEILVVVETLRK